MSTAMWVSPWTDTTDEEQRRLGRRRTRLLHQMRRTLPLERDLVDATRRIETRPFNPGRLGSPDARDTADTGDTAALLAVNNAAFEWHPDQGGWDAQRLAEAISHEWYDPDGFLVLDSADRPGELDGFCWTKVHPHIDGDAGPAAGEIFVIAAAPQTHGSGLGRALTVAGLEYLHGLGLHHGLLYVEADNTAAVSLYERLGFEVHHSDAAYVADDDRP